MLVVQQSYGVTEDWPNNLRGIFVANMLVEFHCYPSSGACNDTFDTKLRIHRKNKV